MPIMIKQKKCKADDWARRSQMGSINLKLSYGIKLDLYSRVEHNAFSRLVVLLYPVNIIRYDIPWNS